MGKLLVWKNGEAPTGPYRSFHNRSWPSAHDRGGNVAASLSVAGVSYSKRAADSGEHEIVVRVADHTNDNLGRPNKEIGAFVWKQLKKKYRTVKEAKAAAEACLKANPQLMRKVDPKKVSTDDLPNSNRIEVQADGPDDDSDDGSADG